ncbi:MAG: DUF1273 family protein [Rikenellaceae bacterium]|nr:DUF1273 family protein [Rikenellaceae bacterium]
MKQARENSVAFTGHRAMNFAAGDSAEALRERLDAILRELYARGARTFYSGMAEGFDLLAARAVLDLRCEYSDIQLIAAVPFRAQAAGFSAVVRRDYDQILAAANRVDVLQEEYSRDCFLRRDDYMVERAATVVAWFDGRAGGTAYTVGRARSLGCEVINLYRDGQMALF